MNRNILNTMNSIFETLKTFVSDDDAYRIVNIDRHIKAQGDEAPVCDFVKRAKIKSFRCSTESICLFEYNEQRYLLVSDEHGPLLSEIGFEIESDIAILQGAGMLAISNRQLPLRDNTNSLLIIEHCLGIQSDVPGETSIEFDFSTIANLFIPYCIVKLDDSRFPLVFEEDLNRLVCYLLAEQSPGLDASAKSRIKSLSLMLSSRTISASILNGIQSPLVEYTFLQFYQCIEYLFKLNNCFSISEGHNLPLVKSIEIVLAHELKITEAENLYQVLKNNASEASIDSVISIIPQPIEEHSDKVKVASNYIYRLRCSIAHLRYDQDDTSNVNWIRCTEALIEVIFSVYQKRDSDIIQICTNKNSWKPISM